MDVKVQIIKTLHRNPKYTKDARDLHMKLGKDFFSDPNKVQENILALRCEGKHELANQADQHYDDIRKIMEKHEARAARK